MHMAWTETHEPRLATHQPFASPLTLVIPAYNRGQLIGATLDSALAQTVPFARIVVVDDGSTDATSEVLQGYGHAIDVVTTTNRGVQAARNLGIEMAATEWVALCDSDDLLEHDFVATLAPWLYRYPSVDVLFSNFVTFNSRQTDPDKLSRCPFDFLAGAQCEGDFAWGVPDLYLRSLRYQPLFASGFVLRKSFVDQYGGYDTRLNRVGAEDWEFTLRAICRGHVAVCKRPLVRVRKHENNDSADALHMSLGEARVLEHSLQHHGVPQSWRPAVEASIRDRRLAAFETAFSRGDWSAVDAVLDKLSLPIWPVKVLAKTIVSKLPGPLKRGLWRALVR